MTSPASRPRARGAGLLQVVAVSLGVVVLTLAIAPLGLTALYAAAGAVALGVGLWLLRDDLREPVTGRLKALWSGTTSRTPRAGDGRRAGFGVVAAGAAGIGAAGIAWAVATQGTKAIAALIALLVGGVAAIVLWPLIVDLARGGDEARRLWAVRQQRRDRPHPTPATREKPPGVVLPTLLVSAAGAGVAWLLSSMGTKGLVAAVGAVAVVAMLALVRDRSIFFTFVAVCSLTLVLHKSLTEQDQTMSGGAISVYVTTFDVMILVLYALWAHEGTLVADLRAAAREPVIWLPLVGVALLLPSLLVAPSIGHAASELARMGWMFLLYVYVAVRVRTHRHLWAILAGLVVFVAIELVVVVLQWRTGGVLGLSFLGVPQTLGERTTDVTAIGRPFGTIIHPVFMAAALGAAAMLALAFAIHWRRSLVRVTATLAYLACLACMWISQTRASFVAVGLVSVVLLVHGIRAGAIPWRVVRVGALLAAFATVLAFPAISRKYLDNFGTQHFWTEVESRLEMNEIAGLMIADHPVLGVGLNNFELVLPRYEQTPVIFFGHPVHNLYLLYLAEAGIIGLLGLLLVGLANYDIAMRVGRSRDPLLRAIGIGVAAAMAFLMIEEILGFSLRQDIPLALYWLLAGLAVAAARMSRMPWPALKGSYAGWLRRTTPPGHARAGRKAHAPSPAAYAGLDRTAVTRRRARAVPRILLAVPVVALAVAALLPPAPVSATQPLVPASAAATDPGVVFTALERATGVQGIFTAAKDGSGVRRISPADGRAYNWPRWAFGNTKIVYTVRTGPPGSPESIAMMDPDGSNVRVLQDFQYRVGQPVVEPDGRHVIFTAQTPWFPQVALFRLDLVTGESRNVSAGSVPVGGFDSDPYTTDGTHVTFIWTEGKSKASVAQMRVDGTERRRVTDDRWFDTDPGVSADGKNVVIASYRGEGNPSSGGRVDFTDVKPGDWHVVVRPTAGGPEKEVTRGENCTERSILEACAPSEMSGFVPRFSPDGTSVTFVGALDMTRTCICFVALDGSDEGAVVMSADLAIDWYDWPQPRGASRDTGSIGTKVRESKVLVVTARPDGTRYLLGASPDLMHRIEIPLPKQLQPLEARWGPDRETIVFTAEVGLGAPRTPHPAPPPGKERRAHVTLDDIDPVATTQREAAGTVSRDEARKQVFLRLPDGRVRQLTDPWIEDWQDGLAPGDARSNTSPVMTPDGRAVIVQNTSTLTGESFLLRIDLRTGAVTNLTNATGGALPTDDAQPALSPDGRRLAFTWTDGDVRSVHVMDAQTGASVAPLTGDRTTAGMPAWAPDGRSLVWVRTEGSDSFVQRAFVTSRGTGKPVTLSGDLDRVFSPVVGPEGDRVLFLGRTGNTLGLYAVSPAGGRPRVLQPDPLHNVFAVDWR